MFLRRVRTLMDELLMSADTPAEERFVENRIDELIELLGPDVLLDRQRWVQGYACAQGRWPLVARLVDSIMWVLV